MNHKSVFDEWVVHMNFVKILVFGACSVIALVTAILCLKRRRAILASIGVLLSTACIVCSCHFWNTVLRESGKTTFLLGYERYPFVLYLIIAIILINLVCISFALVFLFKHEVSNKAIRRMRMIAIGVTTVYFLTIALLLISGSIVGTWTGDGQMDVPNMSFPLEKSIELTFKADGTVIAKSVSSSGETVVSTFTYSLWNDTINVTKDGISHAILYEVKGSKLYFGRNGEFGIYSRD